VVDILTRLCNIIFIITIIITIINIIIIIIIINPTIIIIIIIIINRQLYSIKSSSIIGNGYFCIDEYVEAYFLESFTDDLIKTILKYEKKWDDLSTYEKAVLDEILEFLASCGYNSKHLSFSWFEKLKDFVMKKWFAEYSVALLLEQFVYHKCPFQLDETMLLLSSVLDSLNLEDASVTLSDIAQTTHRGLPLLCYLTDLIMLNENYDNDDDTQLQTELGDQLGE
jgi:hypothetical protein